MGSVVRFVQFTSGSRCVDGQGLCIIGCECKGRATTDQRENSTRRGKLVTLSLIGLARVRRLPKT